MARYDPYDYAGHRRTVGQSDNAEMTTDLLVDLENRKTAIVRFEEKGATGGKDLT